MARFRTLIACLIALAALLPACGGDRDDPPLSVRDADALAFVYADKPSTPALVVYKSGEAVTALSEDGGDTVSGAVFSVPGLAPLVVQGGDDGLPTRAYADGHTFVFRNWQQTTVDAGVVDPSGGVEMFTGVDWSRANIGSAMVLQGSSSAEPAIRTGQGLISAAACVIGEVFAGLNAEAAVPIAATASGTFAVKATVVVLEETAPGPAWLDGLAIADAALAAAGCAVSGRLSGADCVDVVLTISATAIDEAGAAARSAAEAIQELGDALRSARVWKGGELLAALKGHRGYVRSVAFSPDGDTLASGSSDSVTLWDVKAGQETTTLLTPGSYGYVDFSPDGDTLAIDRHGSVTLWDVDSREEIAALRRHDYSINGIVFSRNGRMLASAGSDDTARLWDVKDREEIKTLHIKGFAVNAVAFSPGGSILATGSYMAEPLRLWDVRTGRQTAALHGHADNVRAVAISPDGAILASGSDDGTVKLWDVHARREITTLDDGRPREARSGAVYGVAFSPDGQTLATAVRDRTVHLWDVNAGQEVATLIGHTHGVLSVAFSPDGETLASCGADGTVRLWGRAR
ncbi:hypothetical protein CMK11_08060 [Candidatus Poribacteria bacterium]|nr:hypothetical protein [Candidatus Poribacteria bacterium]